jgi:excisionase family DNA binding protein
MASNRLLTVEEAMEVLRVSRSHIYGLILKGELESIKIGRSRRIPADSLDDFIQRLVAQQGVDCEYRDLAPGGHHLGVHHPASEQSEVGDV